jgi:hypothetical protein
VVHGCESVGEGGGFQGVSGSAGFQGSALAARQQQAKAFHTGEADSCARLMAAPDVQCRAEGDPCGGDAECCQAVPYCSQGVCAAVSRGERPLELGGGLLPDSLPAAQCYRAQACMLV